MYQNTRDIIGWVRSAFAYLLPLKRGTFTIYGWWQFTSSAHAVLRMERWYAFRWKKS